jgi:tRNA A37 N6-isopentenylltransferase MiaA
MSTFIYLGCSISQQNEKDSTVKISKFLQITEMINRTLKPSQVQKHTTLKIYNILALLYYTDADLEQLENRINKEFQWK